MRLSHLPFALFLLACGAGTAPSPAAPTASAPEQIAWQSWSPEAFALARSEGRMVLVDVGIEGCTACRWMYEDTYQHAGVMQRVGEHFVAVAVDANLRPDLGERFARWGWPATVVFAPDGTQVLAVRGNKRPRNFVPILDELIARHASGRLVEEADQPLAVAVTPVEGELGAPCAEVVRQLDGHLEPEHGGWDRRPRHVRGATIEHAFLRAHARRDTERRDHALRTAEGYSQLVDPVWGGVFVAALDDEWRAFIPEKRTAHQAAALIAFVDAYRLTGDELWLSHAHGVHRYLATVMASDEGTFYATQEDDAPGLAEGMSARDYYALGDAERRAHGIPPVDHGVYTDLNGLVIEAYARFYEATSDLTMRSVAVRAAEALLRERQTEAGWLRQSAAATMDRDDTAEADSRMRRFGVDEGAFLSPQARFGIALIQLYRVTGEPRWLDAAKRVGDGLLGALEDDARGGFVAGPYDGTEPEHARRRPVLDNAAAARFLSWLAWATKDERYETSSERALRYVASPEALAHRGVAVVAEAALALELATLGPVELSIVAEPGDPAAAALFAAGLAIYEPRKLLHYEPAGRYPMQDRPAMFVCTASACSNPIFEADEVAAVVVELGAADPSAACGL